MGIEEWKDAGVDLRVYMSTSGDLVLPSIETPIAMNPGGPSGVPNGWLLYLSNPGTMPNNWQCSVASNIFKVGCQTAGYNNIIVGAYYRGVTVDPTKWYQFQIKGRLQDGHNDTNLSLSLQARDPSNGQYYALDQYIDESPTTDYRVYALTQRTAIPARFTQLEVLVMAECKNLGLGSTYNWGAQFTELKVITFDQTASAIAWRDVTCDVQQLSWRYGRERFTNRYDVATIGLQLKNDAGEYSYAKPHPFNLEPGRLVKVEATYEGVKYPQALGVIDQLTDGVTLDGKAVTNVNCLDPTTIFANRSTPSLPTGQYAQDRIYEILRFLGYPLYQLDTGNWYMQQIVASGRSLRDEMGVTTDSEGSSIFADRSGNIVYKNRAWLTTDDNLKSVTANLWAKPESDQPYFDGQPTQAGAPTICLNRLVTDWGMSRVVNYVELACAGGTVSVYQNVASQKKYGPRTYSRHDFVLDAFYADNNGYLTQRATDIMNGYDVPKLRLNQIAYRPGVEGNDWKWTLRAFLNWLVRVWYQNIATGWGWLIVTHVQAIEHRVTPSEWEVTLSVDQPTYYADAPIQHAFAWDNPKHLWDTSGVWV